MRTDLFFIPSELGRLPVFGLGWLLIAWVAISLVTFAVSASRRGFSEAVQQFLPFAVVVGCLIYFVLPKLEVPGVGLPIRGYGLMLLIAVVSGVGFAALRARQVGLNPELIYSLAFWMFVAGIVGARLFYVVVNFEKMESFFDLLKFTEGGLVVYGSFFGAAGAFLVFCQLRKLPAARMADLIAPSLMLGLAIGRLGCLLNGCCYGGLCTEGPFSIQFPIYSSPRLKLISPPYQQQIGLGQIYGVTVGAAAESKKPSIRFIEPDSDAEASGLPVGAVVSEVNGQPVNTFADAANVFGAAFQARQTLIRIKTADGQSFKWSIGELPTASRPVHPTQIYSAINAALLFVFLWLLYPFRPCDGFVMASLLTLYPIGRFLLEMIRDDEGARFGTNLTSAQNVSLLMLVCIGCYWIYLWQSTRGQAAAEG